MYSTILFKGLCVGFTMSAIIGPIAVMCIRRTLAHGQLIGLAIALGASLGNATYGLIAGFGLTFISNFLLAHQDIFRLLGGIFLIYLGIKTAREKHAEHMTVDQPTNYLNTILGAYFLTLSNPVSIVSFTAMFTALDIIIDDTNYVTTLLLVLGIFLGAMIWKIILTSLVRLLHAKINQSTIIKINKCSGAIIMFFGCISIVSILIG